MSDEKIDVLAVWDEAIRDYDSGIEFEFLTQMQEARAAIAELIEADKEYDAAWAVDWGEGGAAPKHVSDRRIAARMRRAAALARAGATK